MAMSQATGLPYGFALITWRRAVILGLLGAACFHSVYTPAKSGLLALLILGYVVCLEQLARLPTTRQSFYTGLGVGFACFAPQLECFWRIFGAGAIALWLILAFWIGLFVALAHLALARLGPKRAALLIPFLWTGLEYFRSELYYLRFSWLNVGYAFAEIPFVPFKVFGIYGLGFTVVLIIAWALRVRQERPRGIPLVSAAIGLVLMAVSVMSWLSAMPQNKRPFPNVVVAGLQLEFQDENEVLKSLNLVLERYRSVVQSDPFFRRRTNVDLVVLPEYTLDGEPSTALKDWCRANRKFLIVGGKDPASGNDYYNTAFVISTNGEVVFKQVKSVPIQFFKDGLAAPAQQLWESPWGKIGICICYDLSYTRVTDELVRQGAVMLIVPTMDVAEWGRHQHELHARVAPIRAAEYRIPIFRVASSGISQGVRWSGRVQSSAPFPGPGEIFFFGAWLSPGFKGSLPWDRWLAPLCVGVTGLFVIWLVADNFRRKRATTSKENPA